MKNEQTFGKRTAPEKYEVAALSLLIKRGPFGADAHVEGPLGSRLAVGSRWTPDTMAGGMSAHVEADPGRLSVYLAMRFDDFDDVDWEAFGSLPIVAGFLATAPIGWFLTESSGLHMRAAVAMDREQRHAAAIRRAVRDLDAERTLTLFGIKGDTIRTIHVGITLERIWTLFDEGLGEVDGSPTNRDYLDVLARSREVPAGAMFAEAIRRHLKLVPVTSG